MNHISILYGLWIRQLKRYWRSRARVIGSLGQPLLFLIALGFGFGNIYQTANGTNYIQFLAPGIIAMGILFTATFSGIEIIWERQFGFLKEMMVSPVSRIEIMIGRTVGGATVAVIQGVVVFFISLAVGFRPANLYELPVSFLFMFLIALLFTALGTAIASVLEDMQGFQLIMNFLIMPLFFFSGALFPLTNAPKALKIIAVINPLSYGIDGLRSTLTFGAHFSFITNFGLLSVFTIAFLFIGSYLFSRIQL